MQGEHICVLACVLPWCFPRS